MKIGIIGVGNMGRAIAERLTEQGHLLFLWNRTSSKAKGISNSVICESPADVVRQADVTISILANDDAIATCYTGPDGLCTAELNGKTIIEMCTTSPKTVTDLDAKVTACGGQFLECPVGGTIGPARAGQLLGLAGGTQAAFMSAKPVLDDITRRIEHLGPVGAGAAMKLAINLPLMVYWGAVGEAIGMATRQGIDPDLATDILVDSSGAIGAAKKRVPPILKMLAEADPGSTSLSLANGIKDMKLMEALAAQHGVSSDVISAARQKAETAASGGWSDHDVSLYGIFGQSIKN